MGSDSDRNTERQQTDAIQQMDATLVSEAPLLGARVLVVDAHLEAGSIMSRALKKSGLEVIWVERGQDALRWLSSWHADIILLDLDLPDDDSMELCRTLCARGDAQVIVIAGEEDAEQHVAALDNGAADVVLRLCPARLLVRRMANVWIRAQQEQAWRGRLAHLAAYLPRAAVLDRPKAPERIAATLLFSDLRGFTRASISHDAAEVFDIINQILALQIGCVQATGGYVDGFSGDGMLALFEEPAGAIQACRAAAQILRLAGQTGIGPWAQLPVALGIHRGEVMRGDLGIEQRRVFTVLGSPVNIAARLCGVASAREVVVSQSLIDALPSQEEFVFRNPRAVRLKGIPEPFWVHNLS